MQVRRVIDARTRVKEVYDMERVPSSECLSLLLREVPAHMHMLWHGAPDFAPPVARPHFDTRSSVGKRFTGCSPKRTMR